ncbi:hypothetical protein K7H91_23435 [Martelella mediterranea]|uniref:hypothetical protein n=1 Tax=Martelella mediterranea TaxID=293089 RepID=UPI001E4BB41B|nr:hypothetical protein [Martelella mediterranea]MCD1636711.1 hypothetical protein [Martelella mediterranea]
MRNPIKALAMATILIAGFAAATTLHAQEPKTSMEDGSMMGQDGMSGMGDMNAMMGMMKMMAQMGPMMEQCTRMMADMTEHMKASPDR